MAQRRPKCLPRTGSAALVALAMAAPVAGAALTPAEARAAGPKISAAFTVDADGDGRVDRLNVRFSAPVKGTSRASSFAVKGMRVLRAAKPRGRTVDLAIAEGTGCDAGGKPAVTFRGGGLKDRRGRAVRRSKVDMEKRDKGAPRMVCAITEDADRNGKGDSVVLSYSKRIRGRAKTGAPFLFSVAGYAIRAIDRPAGRTLRLRVRERAVFDTDATPAVTYRLPARRSERPYAVRSGRRQAFPGSFRGTRDRIAPMLRTALTQDANANGLLDGVAVTFTEPVRVPTGGLDVAGATETGTSTSARGAVAVQLREGPHGTGARPQVAQRGVSDAVGNVAVPGTTSPADGAAPVLSAARTADLGGAAGRLDTLRVTFSEPVTGGAAVGAATPFGVTGYAIASVPAASGQGVDIRLVEASAPDTGARPPVGYTRGRGPAVRDLGGNEAASRVLSGTADGVAPRLLSARTLDENGNGRLDRLRFTFSEPVAHDAESGPDGFSAPGLAPLAAQAAAGANVDVTLAEGVLPNTGARPATAYAPTGANDVRDASGNQTPAATILATVDGAAPVAVSAVTADAGGSNQKLDRVQVTLSEAVVAVADSTAPFSFSASGYTVAGVGAAAGGQVAVNLVEASQPDTGSAPTLAYNGQGVKLIDSAGLESPARTYSGMTADGVAPRLVDVQTRDGDTDGRLDAIDVRYSEQVQGATATSPFSVTAPSRAVHDVSFSDPAVRLALTEGASPDTDQRPTVAYAPGDLTDVPEGAGDTADPVPAMPARQAADAAGPVVVSAVTLDGDSDGTIDAVRATFSELVQHPADSAPPFALRVADRTETAVSSPGGGDDELTVSVQEAGTPDGGFEPDLAVVSAGAENEHIRDLAAPANDAPEAGFSDTADGVRPKLLSAAMGESSGGDCARAPAVNGRIDCVRLHFSEPVSHPQDQDGNYPIGLDNGYSVAPGGLPASSLSENLEVPLAEKPAADRDKSAQVTYNDAVDAPVEDARNNEGLSGSVTADRACADTINEDNDAQAAGNPAPPTASSSLQRRCAFDDDFFKVTATGTGRVSALVRPSPSLAAEVQVLSAGGSPVGSAPSNAGGEVDEVSVNGLTPGGDYWVRVSGNDNPTPQEGTYCLSVSLTAEPPNCGPNEGELILTEVGMDGPAADKFIELKNVSDFPLDSAQVQLDMEVGAATCEIAEPAGTASIIEPGEHIVVTDDTGPGPFRCAEVGSLAAGGNALQLESSGSRIDAVDTTGILTSALAAGHSLQLRTGEETASDNDDVAGAWCRTFTADTRGVTGDGCDEYRVNEILFNPASSGANGIQGRSFVELFGNLPAKAGSKLLGSWVLRGVNGATGDGTSDFTLPATASPRANGTYVVADGVDGAGSQTNLSAGTYDLVWENLDLGDFSWPDLASADPGPRGLQLLRPAPPANPPCGGALADVIGWRQTAENFTRLADLLRQCASVEGGPLSGGTIPTGSSAARLNLSSAAATNYAAGDTGSNAADFCRRGAPSPSQLNSGPCS